MKILLKMFMGLAVCLGIAAVACLGGVIVQHLFHVPFNSGVGYFAAFCLVMLLLYTIGDGMV